MKVHPTSDIQSKNIGSETEIWQFVVILNDAKIGNNCNINAHCFIENDVIIGDNVTIKCGVYLWDGIRVEDGVFIGPSVVFINDKYPRSKSFPKKFLGAYIEKGASIGANATIMSDIRIGKYAVIGAGSVITKNVPENTLWIGNPARQVGFVCNCGHRLDEAFVCISCGSRYKIVNNRITGL
jgi:UDP-2-acetamido-3-amino-2,3-dideoxy-glucuronate N-acetyltransferase